MATIVVADVMLSSRPTSTFPSAGCPIAAAACDATEDTGPARGPTGNAQRRADAAPTGGSRGDPTPDRTVHQLPGASEVPDGARRPPMRSRTGRTADGFY